MISLIKMKTLSAVAVSIITIQANTELRTEHFHNHHDTIIKEVLVDQCQCPETYQLSDTICERIVETPTISICPANHILYNNECVSSHTPKTQCPYEHVLLNNECLKREMVQPHIVCPDGFQMQRLGYKPKSLLLNELDILCVRKVQVPTVQVCPDGSKFDGNCFIDKLVQANAVCTNGYILEDGYCKKSEKYPCTEQIGKPSIVQELVIPVEAALSTHFHKHLRNLEVSIRRPTSSTSDKIVRIDTECIQHVVQKPDFECEVGILQGNFCRIPEKVDSIETCPAFGNIKDCYQFEKTRPVTTCPPGYQSQCMSTKNKSFINCGCTRVVKTPVLVFCEVGYKLEGNICVSRSPTNKSCNTGENMVGDYCQKRESIKAICK